MISNELLQVLSASIVFSTILMSLIQKLKKLEILKIKKHIWMINIFLSFALGVPFGIIFYQLSLRESIWIGIFSFNGAASIYEIMKNYNPTSLSDMNQKEK